MASKTKRPETKYDDSEFARPYVNIAIEYAKKAANYENRKKYCKWIRLAALRFISDLSRAEQEDGPFKFDVWHAGDPCDFIEKLPHVEGVWKDANGVPQPNIVLHESDVFFIVNLFGFRKHDGNRRFTTALKAIARKNAKSTLAAAIGLYCQSCEGEVGPQVITAATTGSQARIVFNIAKRMVEMCSDLREAFDLQPFANAIANYSNGGTYKPINAKASTQDGLNPSATVCDEVHAHKNHDLINVLRSAAGARHNPLFLFTTTEGYESAGPWPEMRRFAEQLLEGVLEADHYFAVIYALDDEDKETGEPADDDFDESAWIKANPLMEVNPILMAEIRKEAVEAKAMPGRHAEFKIKRLNRRAAAAGAWVNLSKWKQCSGPVDLAWLKTKPCYGALDLASTSDLASFRLLWEVEGHFYTHGWRFVPRAGVKHRTERGLVPYQNWLASGHLIEAGDEVTDYDLIQEKIESVCREFNVTKIGYDTWNASQIAKKLKDAAVPLEPFIQGTKSYQPAMKECERAYTAGFLSHGNDPVLNWCMSNVVARKDANLNQAPDKKRSTDKIDDAVTLFMCFGLWASENVEKDKQPSIMFL